MEADSATWREREERLQDPIQDVDFQTDYCKDLSSPADYEIDRGAQSDDFRHREHHKEQDIATCRDHAHRSPVTGTGAPTRPTARTPRGPPEPAP